MKPFCGNRDAKTPPAPAPLTRAEERRGRIIATARMLFAQNGFHNTGMAQIAKHSGVLVGQIYRDFANKEEIVAAIVELDLEPLLAADSLGSGIAESDADSARAWIAHFVAGEEDNDYRLVAEIIAESSRNDRIAKIFRSVQERLQRSIVAALEMLAPGLAKERERTILAGVILTISAGVFQHRMGEVSSMDPDLVAALRRTIDREIDLLRQG